ncbi:GNAT family N-acetyltransferase [Conexibacter sp. JD483]|uniref:GNAT family N-acetyltransferase n=1 Tax=unclassified Conexibacter TaxID=2627773 RepID=UPI00271E5CA2|nr:MULTISPECIES: GNAT family N-acetyltransferase [unclassified Conexibacter]MDO8189398.1 GNAT family N-acetyltransferase [Conexibacter sp. CPCC 205706]MDO8202045.1 GNAT family N-acetyltransferase [Conexibacter sp. CPCC 205762]MDR9372690.1 GNAT family N-acetyltransferase [Conexibacter sp. JD483]
MSAPPPAIALRPATPQDQPFLLRVYASTREQELAQVPFTPEQKAAFVGQQFQAQSVHYARHYGDASFDVVEVDGAPAGRLIVARAEETLLIVDVALLPEFRGAGIGTRLLAPLLAEADAAGKRISIHVERENPAQRLYARLGFAPVADEGVYQLWERQAKTAS